MLYCHHVNNSLRTLLFFFFFFFKDRPPPEISPLSLPDALRIGGDAGGVPPPQGQPDKPACVDRRDDSTRVSVDLAEPCLDGDLPDGSGGDEDCLRRLDRL